MTPAVALERAVRLLVERLQQLEVRLQEGEEAAWDDYRATVKVLASALDHVAPGRRGELLTTEEMARRFGISVKTLLKRKAKGEIRPALQKGRLIRWKGNEAIR
jgi:hypothetical protein